MTYFTSVLANTGSRWTASDIDLDQLDTFTEVAEALREQREESDAVVALWESEDIWCAVASIDAGDEVKLLVSDLTAVANSRYAPVLLAAAEVDRPEADRDEYFDDRSDANDSLELPQESLLEAEPLVDDGSGAADEDLAGDELADADLAEDADAEAAAELATTSAIGWAGHLDVLSELGVSEETMRSWLTASADDPTALLDNIAGALGCSELLDSLR